MTPPDRPEDVYETSRLFSFFSREELTEDAARGALEEFAWRGMSEGRRIREMCEEVDGVLERVSIPNYLRMGGTAPQLHDNSLPRKLLSIPPLSTLFPLVSPDPYSYFPKSPLDIPALPLAVGLDGLTRKQLIDALVWISQRDITAASQGGLERKILEICLDYVGRRWRGVGDGEEGLEEIAKTLTEVEFEVSSRET
jgi:hypothetical protein